MIDYKYYFNDENKDTILLIHGWNTTSLYMEGFIKAFSTSYNIINVDLFNKLNKPYKIENFLDDLNYIIRQHSYNKLVIIGHSFGGKLAYFYSKKYHVDKLVLIAPSLVKPRKKLIKYIKVKLYKWLSKHNLKIPKFLKGSKDYVQAKGYLKQTFLLCHNKYIKFINDNAPQTLVIGFDKDQQVKKYQIRKIKKYIPSSIIKFYPGNHFAYLDYIKEIRIDFDEYLS